MLSPSIATVVTSGAAIGDTKPLLEIRPFSLIVGTLRKMKTLAKFPAWSTLQQLILRLTSIVKEV